MTGPNVEHLQSGVGSWILDRASIPLRKNIYCYLFPTFLCFSSVPVGRSFHGLTLLFDVPSLEVLIIARHNDDH